VIHRVCVVLYEVCAGVLVSVCYLSQGKTPDNIFALPAEVFLSCLAIVSSVMVGGLFLWYRTGYQTVWEI